MPVGYLEYIFAFQNKGNFILHYFCTAASHDLYQRTHHTLRVSHLLYMVTKGTWSCITSVLLLPTILISEHIKHSGTVHLLALDNVRGYVSPRVFMPSNYSVIFTCMTSWSSTLQPILHLKGIPGGIISASETMDDGNIIELAQCVGEVPPCDTLL